MTPLRNPLILFAVFLVGVIVGRILLVPNPTLESPTDSGVSADASTSAVDREEISISHTVSPHRLQNTHVDDESSAGTSLGEFAADIGLDLDYVKSLNVQGLTGNLIVTSEGRIHYGLTSRQARDINIRMKEFIERIKAHDAQAVRLISQTDDEVVVEISPFPLPNTFRADIQGALVSIAGQETGSRIFTENSDALSSKLIGFGEHRRAIIFSNLNEPTVRISEKQFADPNLITSHREWTSPLAEIPNEFRHFLTLQEE